MFQIGQPVNWINHDHQQIIALVEWVDLNANTVDLSFDDGSVRGSIPWRDLAPYNTEIGISLSRLSREPFTLRPRGIDSDEEMGRF